MNKVKNAAITPVKQLALFVKKAKQLRQRKFFDFIASYKSSITVLWQQGADLQITDLAKPDGESFRSFLIDFRQFIANESLIQVNKILKMSANRARHVAFREQLISLQTDWKEINKSEALKDFHGWLNGTIFHVDPEAEAHFDSLGQLIDLVEVGYIKQIGLSSNFITHLADVVDQGLKVNGFDLLNDFTPHVKPGVTAKVEDERSKAAVIRFWQGTKQFPQHLYVCEDHDQDTVIVVHGLNQGASDLQGVTVELRGCCKQAVDAAAVTITKCLDLIDYWGSRGGPPQRGPVQILEVKVTDGREVENIRAALDDYSLVWRRRVGRLRCPVHHMPPGARGFGVDMYHQGANDKGDSVFLQGCCAPFLAQVLEGLR